MACSYRCSIRGHAPVDYHLYSLQLLLISYIIKSYAFLIAIQWKKMLNYKRHIYVNKYSYASFND